VIESIGMSSADEKAENESETNNPFDKFAFIQQGHLKII
jgi:hypothetical protein